MRKFLLGLVLPCLFYVHSLDAAGFGGSPLVESDLIWVHPTESSVFISFEDLASNDSMVGGQWSVARDAVHGEVRLLSEGFLYTPTSYFWDLETDLFAYRRSMGGRSATATVRLMRWQAQELVFSSGFEGGAPPGSHLDGAVTFGPSAALVGASGLQVSTLGADSALWSSDDLGDTSDDGSSTLLGGGFGQFPFAFVGGLNRAAIVLVGVQALGPEEASVRVVLERAQGLPQIRVEVRSEADPTTFVSSKPLVVERDAAHLSLQWWPDGALVEVDGQTAGIFGVPVFKQVGEQVQIGLAPLDPGLNAGATLNFDEVRIYYEGEEPEVPTILLGEDFEAGSVPLWSTPIGQGIMPSSLGVQGTNAFGVDLAQGNSFLTGDVLRGETRLGVRLRVDARSALLARGEELRVLDVGSGNGGLSSVPDVSLLVAEDSSGGAMLAAVNRVHKTVNSTAWFDLTGEHTIELQLRASASSLVSTGILRLWIDGEPVAELTLLDNDDQRLNWVRLGALGVDAGSSGVLFLDDFEIWH